MNLKQYWQVTILTAGNLYKFGHYEQLEGEEYTKIEDAFYRLFDQSMGDWVNNDGGYGMLTINLEDGSYTNEVNYRTIEMDTIEGFLSEF